jgi:[acyl-carrier-protein] S-malonyltransferase
MGTCAFLFPGQASQYPGMGRELYEKFPASRGVFDAADRALDFSVSRLCFEGTEEDLRLTENTQPAVVTVSIAALRALEGSGITPAFVAGHSLGEYSALVAAGGLDFTEAVRLVRQRGRFMQDAVPPWVGAMAAIMGLSRAQVEEACRRAGQGEIVAPANLNSPEQTVISGHASAVKRAVEFASQSGAKRAVILPVSAPFHCELMQAAAHRLEEVLRRTPFGPLKIPLVTNVAAEAIHAGEDAREALIRQFSLPVRWEDSMRALIDQGVDMFVEVGPGKVLSGLLRQIDRSVLCVNVEDEKSLQAAVEKLARARTPAADAD